MDEDLLHKDLAPDTGALLFFKMVQDEEITFHHSKDLDKSHFVLDLLNETSQITFSKRLYFNKEQ